MTISELKNKEDLPYEKCLKYGPAMLSDEELIAVIIRSGTKDISCLDVAKKLIEHYGKQGILGLTRTSVGELVGIDGIGKVKAIMLMCIVELSRRIYKAGRFCGKSYTHASEIAEYLMEDMRHLESEQLRLLVLDNGLRIIGDKVISTGTVNYTCVSPRDIYREALIRGGVYIVVSHNHPSGICKPSGQDEEITIKLKNAGEMVGIPLIDHIIIGDKSYFSFKESGFI